MNEPEVKPMSETLLIGLNKIIDKFEDLSWNGTGENDWDIVSHIHDELREWRCEMRGHHEFHFDQCGYWQHQYCVYCGNAKYPDMASKGCGELTEAMGKTTEEEYLKSTTP